MNATHSPPTAKQINALEKFGVADAKGMSKRRAKQMLDVMFERMNKKLATAKQVTWAVKMGADPAQARQMTKTEAAAFLDQAFGKKPTAAV